MSTESDRAGEPNREAIEGVLDFWFAEETKPRWYKASEAFDDHCMRHFGDLTERAIAGELGAFEESPEGALALCLLLDQMPRNLYRGSSAAFASDRKAVAVAERAIDRGFDRQLDVERRKFFYMPFMHSEILAEQERSIVLCTSLEDEDTLHHALEHADVIRRFGRFPHRNVILGRDSTDEERAFLADGAKTYGQSPKKDG